MSWHPHLPVSTRTRGSTQEGAKEMSPMFSAPQAPSGGIDFKALNGSLLLIDVIAVEEHVPTVHTKPGEKSPAVRADVSVLDGNEAGEGYTDTLIFPKILQSQLNRSVGQKVLGRLGQGVAKPGQSAPWVLSEATAEDVAKAEKWVKTYTPAITSAAAPF